MRVGFIGLGMMGKGMAANLQKAGHDLVVHDLSRAAAEPFLAKGAVWANSPKEVGQQTEVVFTSLPVPADVEQVALAEVFTMGVKAGVDPVDLWSAVRQGATGRVRTFDRLGERFLQGKHDPADFALRLLHKDVGLAVGLGREVGVPMRLANMAYEELTEAMNRGWGNRNSTVGQLLQVERAGIEPLAADPKRIAAIRDADKQR